MAKPHRFSVLGFGWWIAAILLLVAAIPESNNAINVAPISNSISYAPDLIAGYDYPTLSLNSFGEQSAKARTDLEALVQDARRQSSLPHPTSSLEVQTRQEQFVVELNDLVFQVMRHSDQLEIRWTDNWLQKGLAQFYPPLNEPQLPEQVLRQQQGLCSDACKVLQWQLQQAGFDSAFLGLGQHVVLLVRCDDQLLWADPDFGVIADVDPHSGRPRETELQDQLRSRGFSEATIHTYRQILQDPLHWTRLPWNEPLSPRLTHVAKLSDGFVHLAPLVLIVVGLLSFWRGRIDGKS
jgi:hypothetical protein